MSWRSLRVGWLALGGLAMSACLVEADDSTLGVGGGGFVEGTVSCQMDPRLDTYTANLDKPGELGVLSFRLSELTPAPPAKGSNTFVVQVSDASGSAVSGELGVTLNMPDHGHGTSVEPVVSFDEVTEKYTVTPLYLFMAGVWRIEFDAYAGPVAEGLPLDRVTLHFCIEG